ncbi:MAG: BspA family leucine-rich repeat surface protein [Verrucomicrobia bacterium]|nr:BspA family leucine-rich repeat surface protein [Verrucomicrobiota bacterium]
MKTKIIGLFLLLLAAIPLNAQDFYLHDNGVTILCPNAAIGDSATVFGVQYIKRSKDQINAENASSTCTSGITNMSSLFHNETDFNEDIQSWDVSSVTNMSNMFRSARSFNRDISKWDVSNVENMRFMFASTNDFDQDISNWDVSNVVKIQGMFYAATDFNSDLSNWDVSSATNFDSLFAHTQSLNSDLSKWNTSNVVSMKFTFAYARGFGNANIGSWDMSNVKTISKMLAGNCSSGSSCSSSNNSTYSNLISDIGSWDVSNITDMSGFHKGNIYTEQLGDLSNWNVRNVTNMDSMFFNSYYGVAHSLEMWCVINVSTRTDFRPYGSNSTIGSNWSGKEPRFGTCPGELPDIPTLIGPSNNSSNISLNHTFEWRADTSLSKKFRIQLFNNQDELFLDTTTIDTHIVINELKENSTYFWKVQGINFNGSWVGAWSNIWSFSTTSNFRLHENGVTVICPEAKFGESGLIDDITYTKRRKDKITIDNQGSTCTTGVTDLSGLFSDSLGVNWQVSNWDVSHVKNMDSLFAGVKDFNDDLSYWKVDSVLSMNHMFEGASSFNGDLGSWNTEQVTSMKSMFKDASNFDSDISSWDVASVTNMNQMFAGANSFNQDIGAWEVKNVTTFDSLFYGANNFDQPIDDWDVLKVESMKSTFEDAKSFNQNISNWNVSNTKNMDNMFDGALQFDQNLSGWCVRNISSIPQDFFNGSGITSRRLPIWGECPDRNLLLKEIIIDSTYSKKGFKYSTSLSINSLEESDGLISYQFDILIPDGLVYDSLLLFHDESSPSIESNLIGDTLKLAVSGSSVITTHKPLMELFFHADSIGQHVVQLDNVYLNSTPTSNIKPGFNDIDALMRGDVDNTGKINSYDASTILHHTVGTYIVPEDPVKWWHESVWYNWREAAADVDQDGEILALDASYVLKYLVGTLEEFPTYTPNVIPLETNISVDGLIISSIDEIHSINIEVPETEGLTFSDPILSSEDIQSVANTENGLKLAIAAENLMQGDLLTIPFDLDSDQDVTVFITTYTNSVKTVQQVNFSKLTVSNETLLELPDEFALKQNYPNPFNPTTKIDFSLPKETSVRIEIYNSIGHLVHTLTDKRMTAGYHTVSFDAKNLSSGIYFYKMITPEYQETKLMSLIK